MGDPGTILSPIISNIFSYDLAMEMNSTAVTLADDTTLGGVETSGDDREIIQRGNAVVPCSQVEREAASSHCVRQQHSGSGPTCWADL